MVVMGTSNSEESIHWNGVNLVQDLAAYLTFVQFDKVYLISVGERPSDLT